MNNDIKRFSAWLYTALLRAGIWFIGYKAHRQHLASLQAEGPAPTNASPAPEPPAPVQRKRPGRRGNRGTGPRNKENRRLARY